jgi:hypothetical protein
MKIGILAMTAMLAATAAIAAPPGEDPVEPAATAQADQASNASTEAEPEAQDERKICRTERVTGSLSRRSRVCLTAAQWRELSDRTRRGVDEMTSAASGGKRCVPDPADPFQGCPG